MLTRSGKLSELNHQGLTRCDLCVLNLLKPHLLTLSPDSLEYKQACQLLQPFQAALEQKRIVSLTPDGQINFITQQAAKLICSYFPSQNSEALPDSLQRWFQHQISCGPCCENGCEMQSTYSPLHIEQAEKQLVIYLIPDPHKKYYLLLLEEQGLAAFSVSALELLGLTKREAEVLFWIAQDKSNAGISRVLNCCEGTVRKHIENIYKKLGVQTRIGAVTLALERLGILKF